MDKISDKTKSEVAPNLEKLAQQPIALTVQLEKYANWFGLTILEKKGDHAR